MEDGGEGREEEESRCRRETKIGGKFGRETPDTRGEQVPNVV